MSQILITNLSFGYEGSTDMVFEHVSFNLDTDWKLGFTGRNGRGKTTFLNLLLGVYDYQGTISKQVEMLYFPYSVTDPQNLTISILEEIAPLVELWMIQRELSYLDISEEVLYRPFHTLSFGEQTKVLLAILFLKENSFLLIDEPTNHLDARGRKILAEYLKRKKGFILVSHDKMLLDETTDHTLSINKTNIEIQKGNFSSWLLNKDRQDSFEISQNEKHKREIARLESAAKTTKRWSDLTEASKFGSGSGDRGYIGHKAAKMMKRSKSIEKRVQENITEKKKLLKNIEKAEHLNMYASQTHYDTLLKCTDLSAYYDGNTIFGPISFSIQKGDKIVLKGTNGSGKSTLLKLLMREPISYTGQIELANDIVISYVSQDTSMLRGTLHDHANLCGIDETLLKSLLIKLDFSRAGLDKDMESFSAGQKKKVLIATSLSQKAHLYIWDEPLNYIDILSRMQIQQLVASSDITLLFVEHDTQFCEQVSNKVVSLSI